MGKTTASPYFTFSKTPAAVGGPASGGWMWNHPLSCGLLLLFLDAVFLGGYYAFSLYLRHGERFNNYFYPETMVILSLMPILFLSLVGGYSRTTDMVGARYTIEHFITIAISFVFTLIILYFVAAYELRFFPERANVLGTMLIFTVVSLVYRRVLHHGVKASMGDRPIMVVGAGENARLFYRMLRQKNWSQQAVFFDPKGDLAGRPLVPEMPDSPLIEGDIATVLEAGAAYAGAIVIAELPRNIPEELLSKLVSIHFMRTQVQTLENFYTQNWKMVPIAHVSLLWAFEEGFELNRSLVYDRLKRGVDLVVSGAVLVLLSPLMALLALLVKLESKGPAIFRQNRVGRHETTFTLYKFRTMQEGSDTGDIYTRKEDARVTRAGKWLRRFRLDELPQLWNVLKGEMSLIGPRAEWEKCVRNYEQEIPYYHFRHLVKPGITGWAQVNRGYGEGKEDALDKLRYDLYYVRHYSLLLDLTIVLKTIYILIGAKGQ